MDAGFQSSVVNSFRAAPMLHSRSRLTVGFFPFLGFSLVVKLLSPNEGQFDLDQSSLEIDADRHQGQSLFLRLSNELTDFLALQQKLPGSGRLMILAISMGIRADVAIEQEGFSFANM